jgi:hypothetical protein
VGAHESCRSDSRIFANATIENAPRQSQQLEEHLSNHTRNAARLRCPPAVLPWRLWRCIRLRTRHSARSSGFMTFPSRCRIDGRSQSPVALLDETRREAGGQAAELGCRDKGNHTRKNHLLQQFSVQVAAPKNCGWASGNVISWPGKLHIGSLSLPKNVLRRPPRRFLALVTKRFTNVAVLSRRR